VDTNAQPDTEQPDNESSGYAIVPMAAAAALDASAFSKVNASDAVPATWEERARKAWEYYVEEPLVKNCVNSWRTFAVGDEIKITSDDETLKDDAVNTAWRLNVSEFIKDMILQLLVKGDAVGFKRYAATGQDIEEVVCVNPVSVKVKYAQGELIEAKQYAEDSGSASDPIDLPVDQVIHLKWDAPGFSPRGNSLVLPAFQAIELLRDYRRAEQAIAKRWATPFRLLKVGGAFGQKMVMPDQRMLEQVRDMVNKMDMKSGLVVPFYVNVETHGTDGQVLNVEDKVKEVKEDIVVALGLSRSLVTGAGREPALPDRQDGQGASPGGGIARPGHHRGKAGDSPAAGHGFHRHLPWRRRDTGHPRRPDLLRRGRGHRQRSGQRQTGPGSGRGRISDRNGRGRSVFELRQAR
jgi:hypothetical protein